MNEVATIRPNLFLGSAASRTESFLKNNNVTFVVNAANNISITEKCSVPQMKVKCDDSYNEDLSQYFDDVADAINAEFSKRGKVFVHCYGGISRGPSLTMAYLMKYEKMPLLEAHDKIKKKRSFIRPNIGFWKQLVEYEKKILGKNSVTIKSNDKVEYASVYEKEYTNLVSI